MKPQVNEKLRLADCVYARPTAAIRLRPGSDQEGLVPAAATAGLARCTRRCCYATLSEGWTATAPGVEASCRTTCDSRRAPAACTPLVRGRLMPRPPLPRWPRPGCLGPGFLEPSSDFPQLLAADAGRAGRCRGRGARRPGGSAGGSGPGMGRDRDRGVRAGVYVSEPCRQPSRTPSTTRCATAQRVAAARFDTPILV